MRNVMAIMIAAVLCCAFDTNGQELIPNDVLQQVKQASVYIKVSLGPLEYSGSGFVVQSDGESVLLVTNSHVVSKPDDLGEKLPPGFRIRDRLELQRLKAAIQDLEPEIQAVFNSGTPDEQVVTATTVARDTGHDLAVLKVSGIRAIPKPIPLDADYHPAETTPVYLFGFPFGDAIAKTKGNPAITVGRGSISSIRLDARGEEEGIQIDGALNPGNSGGPVVDVKGRLVGIAVAGIRGSGIGLAIPPSRLQRLLSGSIANVTLVSQVRSDGFTIEIKMTLLDPFHRIQKGFVTCALADDATTVPEAAKTLEGARVELTIENGKATANWTLPQALEAKQVIHIQATFIDDNGKERQFATSRHPLQTSGTPSQANALTRRRGPFSLVHPPLEGDRRDRILVRLRQKESTSILLALQELVRCDPNSADTEIASVLEHLIGHTDDSIRALSAKLIGDWALKDRAAAVLKLLDDPAPSVRHAAMATLSLWQLEDAIEPMIVRLHDTSDRLAAKQALIRLGPQTEPAAVKLLNDGELTIRLTACEILAEIGTKDRAIPILKQIADRETGLVASRAREAIDQITLRASNPKPWMNLDAKYGTKKVHLGLQAKQGEMLLTEGVFVTGDFGLAIGLGFVQTGDRTMELTYLALINLPRHFHGPATFSSRKKRLNNRVRVIHAAYWGDEEMAIEHFYVPDKLPFVDEEFIIRTRQFKPENGRLFLVDVKASEPVVIQKKIELPSIGPLVELTDESVMRLTDLVLDELLQSNEDVRSFLRQIRLLGK